MVIYEEACGYAMAVKHTISGAQCVSAYKSSIDFRGWDTLL